MKTFRKILAFVIIAVLCVSMMSMVAFADDPAAYTIVIDNAVKGETYTAYKIFDVTYSGSNSDYVAPDDANDVPGAPDAGHQYTAYAYTIDSTNAWWSVVTSGGDTDSTTGVITANGLTFTPTTTAGVYNVAATDSFLAATFAALLNNNKSGKTAAATVTASNDNMSSTIDHGGTDPYYTTGSITLTVTSSGAGYYFVDTSLGALCSLDTTEPNATIREKNSLPTVEKTVSDSASGTYGTSADLDIGDTVYYKIVVTDGTGTDADITVHDVLSAGQTLVVNSFKVLNGTTAVPAENYTITYGNPATVTTDATYKSADGYVAAESGTLSDTCTFEVVLDDAYVATLDAGNAITVTYSAILNDNAVIAGAGNPNTTHLTYSNQTSTESETRVYTYAGALYKFNSAAEELSGASFTMADSGNTAMYFVQVNAGSEMTPAVYRYDSLYTASTTDATDTITTPASGAVVIYGLDVGSYTLTETAAPTGYNKLTETKTLTIAAASTALASDVVFPTSASNTASFVAGTDDTANSVTYQLASSSVLGIENKSGTELPSTGGIGTTLFYVIGGVLLVGAGVLLVTKKRTDRDF